MTNDKLFDIYSKELIEWNKKFNLTSITDPEQIRIKHFEDSLAILNFLPISEQSIIDIGTGAGFPGLPIKIACPQIKLTLLEATNKKGTFLNHIVSLLKLTDVEVLWKRAEDLAEEKREFYDIALARAVAKLNLLCEWALPLIKVGGTLAAYKEENVEQEVKGAEKAIKILGGKLKEIKKYTLKNGITHSLVFIEKISRTPREYPRQGGLVKAFPL